MTNETQDKPVVEEITTKGGVEAYIGSNIVKLPINTLQHILIDEDTIGSIEPSITVLRHAPNGSKLKREYCLYFSYADGSKQLIGINDGIAYLTLRYFMFNEIGRGVSFFNKKYPNLDMGSKVNITNMLKHCSESISVSPKTNDEIVFCRYTRSFPYEYAQRIALSGYAGFIMKEFAENGIKELSKVQKTGSYSSIERIASTLSYQYSLLTKSGWHRRIKKIPQLIFVGSDSKEKDELNRLERIMFLSNPNRTF